jgi:putative transposase
LNAIKREQFPWRLEVTKNAPQRAIIQLSEVFKHFFRPDGCRIRIPHLGWVRMRELLRFAGKLMSATVSRVADRWFVRIAVDTQEDSHLLKAKNQGAVGVNWSVSHLATLSMGEALHKALLGRLLLPFARTPCTNSQPASCAGFTPSVARI